MGNKIKRIVSGLMCMALLTVYTVPVNAAQYMGDRGIERSFICNHVNIEFRATKAEYTSRGSSAHYKKVYGDCICMDCYAFLRHCEFEGLENHSWTTYRDLGHVELTHNYEVVCGACHHTERTSVPCDNENGPHKTPF